MISTKTNSLSTKDEELSSSQISQFENVFIDKQEAYSCTECSSNIEVMSTKFDLNKYYNMTNLTLEGNKHKYYLVSNENYMSIYLSDRKEDDHNYFELGINNIRKDYID